MKTRYCGACGEILIKKPTEKSYNFAERKTCNIICRGRMTAALSSPQDSDGWWRELVPWPGGTFMDDPRAAASEGALRVARRGDTYVSTVSSITQCSD